jgi:hypothetical protein
LQVSFCFFVFFVCVANSCYCLCRFAKPPSKRHLISIHLHGSSCLRSAIPPPLAYLVRSLCLYMCLSSRNHFAIWEKKNKMPLFLGFWPLASRPPCGG